MFSRAWPAAQSVCASAGAVSWGIFDLSRETGFAACSSGLTPERCSNRLGTTTSHHFPYRGKVKAGSGYASPQPGEAPRNSHHRPCTSLLNNVPCRHRAVEGHVGLGQLVVQPGGQRSEGSGLAAAGGGDEARVIEVEVHVFLDASGRFDGCTVGTFPAARSCLARSDEGIVVECIRLRPTPHPDQRWTT